MFWIQNERVISKASIWQHFHWYMINLRCSLHQKRAEKGFKKSQICVLRLLEALFVVKEKYSEVITDEGHYNDEFDTHYIYIWWIESVVFNENKVKKHQKGPNWWFETLFSVYMTPYFHKISMKVGVKLILLLSSISFGLRIFFSNNKQSL